MESLEKMLFSIMAIVFCLSLSACNYGIFDWNNQNLDKRKDYKNRSSCTTDQQSVARVQLQDSYNKAIDQDIFEKCTTNSNYRFKSDPKYK
ncbi:MULTISPECIES: hypothetical protein [Psychrobacter]|uniref:hypothetical protein n=1 Tax=Psychrobacter TaxID=497 RepID=UPI000ED3327A|nr:MULTISPECIES: hypothetical protein [Psychrobacter]WLW67434.1 hypothetical protein RAH45_05855 [Psychrobacter sp. van23A]HCR88237.1 hypothetical protein [Psychrobacter sp.]